MPGVRNIYYIYARKSHLRRNLELHITLKNFSAAKITTKKSQKNGVIFAKFMRKIKTFAIFFAGFSFFPSII